MDKVRPIRGKSFPSSPLFTLKLEMCRSSKLLRVRVGFELVVPALSELERGVLSATTKETFVDKPVELDGLLSAVCATSKGSRY